MDVDKIVENMSEREILEHLTKYGYLDGAAHGIALQVVNKGLDSLKGGQQNVYDKFIVEKYFNLNCRICGAEMPTSEILAALMENDELCGCCRSH